MRDYIVVALDYEQQCSRVLALNCVCYTRATALIYSRIDSRSMLSLHILAFQLCPWNKAYFLFYRNVTENRYKRAIG